MTFNKIVFFYCSNIFLKTIHIPTKIDIKTNKQIRHDRVRLIGSDGKVIGEMSAHEAQREANAQGLDLIQLSEGNGADVLPVCRITDGGKYFYEKQKKKAPKEIKTKQIRFHLGTAEGDLKVKIEHVREFLQKGCQVKVTLQMAKYEVEGRSEEGKEKVAKFVDRCVEGGIGKVAGTIKLSGKWLNIDLIPTKSHKKEEKEG